MRIDVTQDDIDNGKARSNESCPIALACKRAGLSNLTVGNTMLFKGLTPFARLPDTAYRFILEYDDYGFARPFSFDIDI